MLAACAVAGINEVYAIGGAQAIAAFAFGTETVPRVDVIAGPGNRYVTEAKRIVSGPGRDRRRRRSERARDRRRRDRRPATCSRSTSAPRPSTATTALLLLISPTSDLLDSVAEQVERARRGARQRRLAAPSRWSSAPGVQRALELSDAFAPEHLQLAFDGADDIVARARLAGCVFVGDGAATAFGDYAAGSNHVLPTGGAARFGGPLGPRDLHAPRQRRHDPVRGRRGARADGRRARPRRGPARARRVGRRPQPPN